MRTEQTFNGQYYKLLSTTEMGTPKTLDKVWKFRLNLTPYLKTQSGDRLKK